MEKVSADAILRGIRTLVNPAACAGRFDAVATTERAAVAFDAGIVTWAGPESDLGSCVRMRPGARRIDAAGLTAMPGLVECHTHAIFEGTRVDDFERRSRGETYSDIARKGGGILSTVRATRTASRLALKNSGRERLSRFLSRGVTTVEIKSGYGLDTATELKILATARQLGREHPVTVITTFLGAHTVPPEFMGGRRGYLRLVIDEMLPAVARRRLARYCDVFCDETAFSAAEAREILVAAAALGLKAKVHADQLSAGGGAELAAEVGAVSADHLEHVSDNGVRAMRKAGVTAVLLPAAAIFIGSQARAPARKMIDAGLRVAVSTDFNPGSSNTQDLALAGTLACSMLKMTPAEAFAGITINAAAALGLEKVCGSVEPGKWGDVTLIDAPDWRDIFYRMGENLVRMVIKKGGPTAFFGR
ncbi:MAG: imidazolonepropionase [Deltaproteobacteria bacterium]|nr:imidazolonepropionase [Deltaproteobacteria bacterium]